MSQLSDDRGSWGQLLRGGIRTELVTLGRSWTFSGELKCNLAGNDSNTKLDIVRDCFRRTYMSHGAGLDGAPAGTKYLVVLCRVDDLFRPDGEITVHLKGYTQSSKFPISSWRKWLPPPQFVWRPVRGGL